MAKETNVHSFLADLGVGVFEDRLGKALSLVAADVVDNDRAGEVIIKLKLKPIGNNFPAVTVVHELSFKSPTLTGNRSETIKGLTNMHVGKGGSMTYLPENQGQLFEHEEKPTASNVAPINNARNI